MQNKEDKQRNSLQDMGLLISIGVFIIMLIKSALFGFSWVSIVWLVLVLAYWCLIYFFTKKTPNPVMIKNGTIGFLCVSAFLLIGATFFDQNARPKMHAFEGAANDSIAEEDSFIIDETPDITVVAQPDTIVSDSLHTDSLSAAPESADVPEAEAVEEDSSEEE